MDIESLRYVVTLAEELHFGRSARRHYIGEAPFGRRIRRVESELGMRIFDRTSRRVSLTAEGTAVVARIRQVLADLDALGPSVVPDLPGVRVGVLGFGVGDRWRQLRREVLGNAPGTVLTHVGLTLESQYSALRRHEVDVALVHYLGDVDGIDLLPVMQTPRVAVVPLESSYAQADRLSIDDVPSGRWIRFEGTDDRFSDWVGPPATGVFTTTLEMLTTAVATTGLIGIHGAAAATFFSHPDVCFVPLEGPPITAAVATRHGESRPAVLAFRSAAKRISEPSARP